MTDASKHIAFIGIGKMGLPMSVLVAKAGYVVTAFDRSTTRLDEARAQGISIAASPAEAVGGKVAIITSLPDDAALRGALL
ncbi:MAG: NAD(P)-binding domain-containing protein, partial [Bradyrhizobium sp.]|nr:NAD(P)-binding domain-containing protein [Bradyrhizobium sp.]